MAALRGSLDNHHSPVVTIAVSAPSGPSEWFFWWTLSPSSLTGVKESSRVSAETLTREARAHDGV
jgi:hypothetical protein